MTELSGLAVGGPLDDVSTTLLETATLSVVETPCQLAAVSRPIELPERKSVALCLVRRGSFAYRDGRGRAFGDPTTGILRSPQHPTVEVCHPDLGHELDTMMFVAPSLWASVTRDEQVPLAVRVTGAMHLAHRRLLAAAWSGADPWCVEEQALGLIADAVAQAEPARVAAGGPATVSRRRQLVEDARTLLSADPTGGSVAQLANALSCSPHHLSRIFAEYTGTTLGAYRTKLRVNLAIEHLADRSNIGQLAHVAAKCGFFDHAHLSRTLHRHLGMSPTAVRAAVVV